MTESERERGRVDEEWANRAQVELNRTMGEVYVWCVCVSVKCVSVCVYVCLCSPRDEDCLSVCVFFVTRES